MRPAGLLKKTSLYTCQVGRENLVSFSTEHFLAGSVPTADRPQAKAKMSVSWLVSPKRGPKLILHDLFRLNSFCNTCYDIWGSQAVYK